MNAIKYLTITIGALMLSVLLAGLSSAHADSTDSIETSYEVNVSGITALDVRYSADISATGYRSRASIKTRGIATFFSEYLMVIVSSGRFVAGRASPVQYISRREKKDKIKTVELNWSEGALVAPDRQVAKNPDTQMEINTALALSVTDPLTAILRIGTPQTGGPCQSNQKIFDGKEIFDLRFSFQQEVLFDDDSPGAYHGKAYKCQMTYVPVAGRYATKFRERNEVPPTYTVWLAPIGTVVSGESLLVPVRATGKLDGLKFVAYANRVRVDGRPFKVPSSTGN